MRRCRCTGLLVVCLGTAGVFSQVPPPQAPDSSRFLVQPLVTDIYTADPSAHVFAGRIYVYPSHDFEAGVKPDDLVPIQDEVA